MEDGRPFTKRFLARLPFVRSSFEEDHPVPADVKKSPPPSPTAHRRRRKGSLRKTLLTTGHIVASSQTSGNSFGGLLPSRVDAGYGINTLSQDLVNLPKNYGSSTDEDGDGITLRPRSTSGSFQILSRPLAESPPTPIRGRRKSMRSTAPLLPPPSLSLTSTVSSSLEVLAPPVFLRHDYSETEWWGWIILLATWIVFVVGMGSCLGVWSWAWDVGETPYAPPELEDDPTLPIVGYYPALIIMTGVMAWVWVIIAWVGMKYFRHAKVWDGEES